MSKKLLYLTLMYLLIFSLSFFSVSAQNGKQYHLKLLAVQETTPTSYTGSEADLYIELKEGSGRVFLETFPLPKADTQISTRFAKEIACTHFKLDCDQHDFIYTIRAKSNIIGGPSAGAAVAALTTIALLDLPYTEEIAITGTINSGGIVGPVGGVKEKIDAASSAGIQTVLIAQGSRTQPAALRNGTESNATIDLIDYGKQKNVTVLEVADLDDVIVHVTGKELNHKEVTVLQNEEYARIMEGLQNVLCERADKQLQAILKTKINLSEEVIKSIHNKKSSAFNASARNDFYSAASFCFSANIQLQTEKYKHDNLSVIQMEDLATALQRKSTALSLRLSQEPIDTISDLQTLMIVKERLQDVQRTLREYKEKKEPSTEGQYNILAYAEERFFSAIVWMQFFAMDGKRFVVDGEHLQQTCQEKIAEAEERYQYTSLFLSPLHVSGIREKIDAALGSLNQKEYALCIITASQAKADANAVLSSLGVPEESIHEFINSKRKAAERVIAENSARGIFPILGYSYYQYANSLQEQEPYTALVYLEYALEMSDLALYFPEEKSFIQEVARFIRRSDLVLVGEGVLIGILATLLVIRIGPYFVKKNKRVKKKSKK